MISDERADFWEIHLWFLILATCVGAGLGAYAALRVAGQRQARLTGGALAAAALVGAVLLGARDAVSEFADPEKIAGVFPVFALVLVVSAIIARAIGLAAGARKTI